GGAAGSTRPEITLVILALFSVATAAISPVLWASRYNLHLAASFAFGIQYLSGRWRSVRLAEGAAVFCVIANMMWLYWAYPGYFVGWATMKEYFPLAPLERGARGPMPWAMAPEVARARDTTLGPGSLTVFSDDTPFPALLWNDQYTNRIAYVKPAPTPDMLR